MPLSLQVLGPRLMENRKPFQLKNTLIVYNFIQVVFSAWLFYEVEYGGRAPPKHTYTHTHGTWNTEHEETEDFFQFTQTDTRTQYTGHEPAVFSATKYS